MDSVFDLLSFDNLLGPIAAYLLIFVGLEVYAKSQSLILRVIDNMSSVRDDLSGDHESSNSTIDEYDPELDSVVMLEDDPDVSQDDIDTFIDDKQTNK